MTTPLVIFSHGLDGHPRGSKIVAMREVAHAHGYRSEALDYQGMPPLERVDTLRTFGRTLDVAPVLVGSSLGGHVAAAASAELKARGLFLLAPAFYMPGYEQYTPRPHSCPISILHGWRDDVVPVDSSLRFAREYHAQLTLIDADHRMLDVIDQITAHFELFLRQLARY
jgi:pimeloyl-ACP methyl ester carboxylesterase